MRTFYDPNQYHWIRDPAAYRRQCDTILVRACSRNNNGIFYKDTKYDYHLKEFGNLACFGHYQYVVEDRRGPEWQADFYSDTVGPLQLNQWGMLDIEDDVLTDPVDFAKRWLSRWESRNNATACVYCPKKFWDKLKLVIGDRLLMVPRYNKEPPYWGRWDIWQDSQTALFPGGGDAGDRNRTNLTSEQMLIRTQSLVDTAFRRRTMMLANQED